MSTWYKSSQLRANFNGLIAVLTWDEAENPEVHITVGGKHYGYVKTNSGLDRSIEVAKVKAERCAAERNSRHYGRHNTAHEGGTRCKPKVC